MAGDAKPPGGRRGAALLVLAANANDAGIWARSLQLPLHAMLQK